MIDAPRVRYVRLPERDDGNESAGNSGRGALEPLEELPTPLSLTNSPDAQAGDEEGAAASNWKANLARQFALDASRSENESPLDGEGQRFFGHKISTGLPMAASTEEPGPSGGERKTLYV